MEVDNVVLIVLDTLRNDYGEKYIGPILKEFGFKYYSNVIAPSPWTIPTHASIFLGEYPSIHAVHEDPNLKIPHIKVPRAHLRNLLSTQFQRLGYTTILISANELVQPTFGFVGFDVVHNIFWAPKEVLSSADREELEKYTIGSKFKYILTPLNLLLHGKFRLFKRTILELLFQRRILSFLKRYPLEKGISKAISIVDSLELSKNNFIFINLIEVHEPYSLKYHSLGGINFTLTGRVTNELIRDWKRGYPKEAKYLASKLKRLLLSLKTRGLFRNSILIVTSDHGQLLGEMKRIGHGVFLDDELVRVPLWIRFPEDLDVTSNIDGMYTYFSLVDLYNLVLNLAVNHDGDVLNIPFRNVVFSESHGIPTRISSDIIPEDFRLWISNLEKHRIAVYHGPYKGIYNVDDGILECVKSYDGSEITEDVRDMLIKDVKKFLRGVRLKTAVRRVNLKGKI